MIKYDVTIYREMRLRFDGIEADTPQAAAEKAKDMLLTDADDFDECDGETLAALVDVEGDEDFSQSVIIDFEPVRQRNAAPRVLAALKDVLAAYCYWLPRYGDKEAVNSLMVKNASAAIAEADAAGIVPASDAASSQVATIPAEAHSDDHVIGVEFDAVPWFEQATDQAVRNLSACGWAGDYPADAVAISLAEAVPGLARLFAYLEIIADDPVKKDCRGFECRVDEARAMGWLRRHRQALWAELSGNKPYSVLLLYPDYVGDFGTETFYALVEANDPTDFAPLLVTAGHHASEPLFNK